MKEVRSGKYRLYKREYCIVFYDKTGEWIEYMFDNVRDILKFMGKPINKTSVNIVNQELYSALRSDTHFCRFLTGEVLRVYIFKTK